MESSVEEELDHNKNGGDDHMVEMVSAAARARADSDSDSDQIAPLLTRHHSDTTTAIPKINIFSFSYPRRFSNREQVARLVETETSPFTQSLMWVWGGSRYSGLLCMAISASIYFFMEVLSDVFTVQSIPLFQIAFTRCTIMVVLSFIWLRKTGQTIFGPTNVRKLLVSRAIVGFASLMSFVYCIQRLPLSEGIILSFTSPIMASAAARIILHEKIKISEIGGLSCSFVGVLLIFRSMLTSQGRLPNTGEASDSNVEGSYQIYALVIGLFSSAAAGISYCLIRAGAKASDQPIVTVFSFGMLASPAAAICTFAFQEFVMPGLYSFFLMVILGVLAFFAETFSARGLQLEKTSKVANILYLEAALSQFWSMGSLRAIPSFSRVVGCLLILASTCSTLFIGPEKEVE